MNLRNLYLINVVVALIFALGLLLGPATMLKILGMTAGTSENLVAQLLGAALIAPALMAWFGRDVSDPSARQAVVVSLLISDAVGFVVSALGTLSNTMKAAGWLVVIIFLFFAVGYGYFQFIRPNEA
jgi:phosphate/sulfate permease